MHPTASAGDYSVDEGAAELLASSCFPEASDDSDSEDGDETTDGVRSHSTFLHFKCIL